MNSRISAGTKGCLNFRAKLLSLQGQQGTEINIEINNGAITLERNLRLDHRFPKIEIQKIDYKVLDNNIFYLNLRKIEMKTITKLLPELEQANGIVCDLRGYPNSNYEFISHLLVEKDTFKAWMQVSKKIYPDNNKIGYENYG